VGLTALAMMVSALVEKTQLSLAITRSIDRATTPAEKHTELLFRAGCAFFFVSIWAIGGILLTPELKTNSQAVGVIHLLIAAGMLSRRTMPISALGIAVIFAIGVWQYGIFHLADYPIFLGVAVYLALTGLNWPQLFGLRPIDLVRWSAGITLMWASIEKWAYPEWSFPILNDNPSLTMGYDPEFFMRAAGAVEFALAFALLWTPLSRRLAATVLATMFISAVFQFGKIDLIGHSLIVVVLVAIVADSKGKSVWQRYSWFMPLGYACALVTFLTGYYVAHSLLYGTSIM
jgi:hypothetical protein